jgi:hypothetical protein
MREAKGPAMTLVKSSTRTPDSASLAGPVAGLGMVSPVSLKV